MALSDLGEDELVALLCPGDVRLQLVKSRPFESGLVQLEYRVFKASEGGAA